MRTVSSASHTSPHCHRTQPHAAPHGSDSHQIAAQRPLNIDTCRSQPWRMVRRGRPPQSQPALSHACATNAGIRGLWRLSVEDITPPDRFPRTYLVRNTSSHYSTSEKHGISMCNPGALKRPASGSLCMFGMYTRETVAIPRSRGPTRPADQLQSRK